MKRVTEEKTNSSFEHFILSWRVILLFLVVTSGDCSDLDLGMESGSIPDSKITASSELNANTPATNGRLNYRAGSSWCAAAGDSNPHLQIDLRTLHFICTVSTQGNSQADEWVETYTLQISTDGTRWTDYTDSGGQVKVVYLVCFFHGESIYFLPYSVSPCVSLLVLDAFKCFLQLHARVYIQSGKT